jgi:hypothetical protein
MAMLLRMAVTMMMSLAWWYWALRIRRIEKDHLANKFLLIFVGDGRKDSHISALFRAFLLLYGLMRTGKIE